METLNVTFKGVSPLLMHSCVGVNPTHPLTVELKKLTKKRNKTEEDQIRILDLHWLLGIYHDNEIGPYIPAENVEATLRESAKKTKQGKLVTLGVFASPDRIPLLYDGPRDTETLMQDINFRDVKVGVIQRARVLVCRPRFNHWSCNFTLDFDETVIDKADVIEIIKRAGSQIGICDYRPRYGRFEAVIK